MAMVDGSGPAYGSTSASPNKSPAVPTAARANAPKPPWGDTYANELSGLYNKRNDAADYLQSIEPEYRRASQHLDDLQRACNALENG